MNMLSKFLKTPSAGLRGDAMTIKFLWMNGWIDR